MSAYFEVNDGGDMSADNVQKIVDEAKEIRKRHDGGTASQKSANASPQPSGTATTRGTTEQEDLRERVVAAGASARKNADGSTTILNAAGGELGSIGADGSFTHNPNETTTQGMYRDADGKLHWDNGKLAGPAPKPNQDDQRIPKGGFAAQKQAEMDALKTGEKSEATRLTEAAWKDSVNRGQTKVLKPGEKPDNAPRFVVIDDGGFEGAHRRRMERRRGFIENNPNAVSPQERASVLGRAGADVASHATSAGGDNGGDLERAKLLAQEQKELDASIKRASDAQSAKQKAMNRRRIALGNAAGVVFGRLGDEIEAAKKDNSRVVTTQNGRRFVICKLDGDNLDVLNKTWKANGGGSEIKDIYARIEVDSNGDVMKGASPQFIVRDSRSGQTGSGELGVKAWTADRMETAIRDAYVSEGHSQADADALTYKRMGGYGQIGKDAESDRLRKEKENELKTKAAEQAIDIAGREIANKEKATELASRIKNNVRLNRDDLDFITGRIDSLQGKLAEIDEQANGHGVSEQEYKKQREAIVNEINRWKGLLEKNYFPDGGASDAAEAGGTPTDGGGAAPNQNADDAKSNAADALAIKNARAQSKSDGAGDAKQEKVDKANDDASLSDAEKQSQKPKGDENQAHDAVNTNPRSRQKPSDGRSKGRREHEGMKGSYAKALSESNAKAASLEEDRKRKLEELRKIAFDERNAWIRSGKKGKFVFSRQKELDELIKPHSAQS